VICLRDQFRRLRNREDRPRQFPDHLVNCFRVLAMPAKVVGTVAVELADTALLKTDTQRFLGKPVQNRRNPSCRRFR